MRRQKIFVSVLLALLVVLAGCSGGADSSANGGGAADRGQSVEATASSGAGSGGSGSGGGDAAASAADAESVSSTNFAARRELIRTGQMWVRVDDFAGAERNLTAAVEARGGYVSDTSQVVRERGNETWTTGTLVLRVPKENFSALMGDVRTEGEVERSNTSTQDVTDQVVDLEARLSNLRAERDRLRTLYERANETEDVLRVGQELSQTQGEIERLEAQLRALEGRVAYSTLTVTLEEPRPEYERIQRASWYDTGVVTAFLDSIDGVVVTLRAVVVGAAYAAPYLLVFGLPLVGAAVFVRRRRWLGRFR